MSKWFIAPGPASKEFAELLACRMHAPLINVEYTTFPDGESKIRVIGDVRNKRVIMVQSTYPPVDVHIIQALMLSYKLSQDGGEVYAVIPYLGYARQDKEFLEGEVVSLALIARLLRSVGVKRLITVDIHSSEGLGYFPFPAYSISAIPALAEYVNEHHRLNNPIVVSPDFGASARAEGLAKLIDSEHIVLSKKRNRITGEVSIEDRALNIEGRDVVIIDDIISTGGSVQKAALLLKRSGARKIIALCTHAIMVSGALEKIISAGVEEVIGTNTVPSAVSKVDVTPLIAEYFSSL
ncbi:MAG: ribose-phosphate pyrophosphokinase [Nitrososphaerota archaeon]|nr:ribose-phosphate pyrophosphokinase [Nitrososphaerota archaeon]